MAMMQFLSGDPVDCPAETVGRQPACGRGDGSGSADGWRGGGRAGIVGATPLVAAFAIAGECLPRSASPRIGTEVQAGFTARMARGCRNVLADLECDSGQVIDGPVVLDGLAQGKDRLGAGRDQRGPDDLAREAGHDEPDRAEIRVAEGRLEAGSGRRVDGPDPLDDLAEQALDGLCDGGSRDRLT